MQSASKIDPTPTPSPASEVVPLEARDNADAGVSSHTPARPDLFDCVERGRRGRDQAGLEQAARQFEGDLRAELAAIEAGTHPLQQGRRASQ
jgi:hypothetical protein